LRSLGELSGKDEATQFVNILAADDIEAKTDALGEGRFEVWIYNEDDMSQAFETFKEFKASGLTQEFQEKAKLGKEKACEANTSRPQVVDVRTQVFGKTSSGLLTNAMIGVCILLFFLEYRLGNEISLKYFYMADLTGGRYYPGLNEILAGEVWRLVSWSFLHGSLFHILFNMAWLYKLGRMVEEVSGVFAFVVLFLVSGVVGGLLQYWATGPYFVGMSGFVYALFGYSWIMGRFFTRSRC
jgi:GlpG protein